MSLSHIQAAFFFSREAAKIEDLYAGAEWGKAEEPYAQHRSFVIGSIFSSVAFLEAAINEFISDAADSPGTIEAALGLDNTKWLSVLWKGNYIRSANLLDKYQMILSAVGKGPFDKGRNPYQDVAKVCKIRNELVHYKPEVVITPEADHWAERLRGKFAANRLFPADSGNPFFPDKLLGHGCA